MKKVLFSSIFASLHLFSRIAQFFALRGHTDPTASALPCSDFRPLSEIPDLIFIKLL